MDAKAINEKSKALIKATSAGESPSIIIGILNELKTGVVPSEDLLRSTKIGVTVNKSKQHKNPEVARLASEIVRKWRDDISKQKFNTPNGGKKMNGTPPNGTSSPAPSQEKSKPSSTPSVPPAQRSWKKDRVDIARTGQSNRDNCIGLIYNGLVPMSTVPSATVLSVAVSVEAAAFAEHGPEEKESYKLKMRSLYQNLKNKSNPSLRTRVLNGDISSERFVVMSHEELKSAERREEDKKIIAENMRNAQAPMVEKSISTSLTCGKCGQRKVSYSQAQTRSADEPMTTFFLLIRLSIAQVRRGNDS
ncbi:RNA polymerase II elongation factor [Lignoscripta atroalba]|nr:RNA polymerase II elongation factor [Lignoscripta atroalba]